MHLTSVSSYSLILVALCFVFPVPGRNQLIPNRIQDWFRCLRESTATPHSVQYLKTDDWLRRFGYNVDNFKVVTEDGYELKIFRVFSYQIHPDNANHRPVVFLNHGLSGSSNQWLIQEGPNNLVQTLVDAGYEVWLGNCRGNSYSNKHAWLSEDDEAYWDFSWHEMGIYDVPAVIDKILSVTKLPRIYYIGYSMGATQYAVMLSERPEYNSKIKIGILLGPAIICKSSTSQGRAATVFLQNNYEQLLRDPLLKGRIITQNGLDDTIGYNPGQVCASSSLINCNVCSNSIFSFYGRTFNEMNYTALPSVYTNNFDIVGTNCIVHYAQLMNDPKGRFRKFDYGPVTNYKKYRSSVPPEYNLQNVNVPTYIFYGGKDTVIPMEDVEEFASRLKYGVVKKLKLLNGFSHLDFVCGRNAYKYFGGSILDLLNQQGKS